MKISVAIKLRKVTCGWYFVLRVTTVKRSELKFQSTLNQNLICKTKNAEGIVDKMWDSYWLQYLKMAPIDLYFGPKILFSTLSRNDESNMRNTSETKEEKNSLLKWKRCTKSENCFKKLNNLTHQDSIYL